MSEHGSSSARRAAGIARRPDIVTLVLSGPDRIRFLNGMLTNDVARLEPGRGMAALKLSAKGRVEAYVRVRAEGEELSIDVRDTVAAQLEQTLERHMIMDDCALRNATSERTVLSLIGPNSASILGRAGLDGERALAAAPHAHWRQGAVELMVDSSFGLPGFELHVAASEGDVWYERLVALGAERLDRDDLEVLRVEAGTPREGAELTEDVLPLEADLRSAIDFEKGCYVGQEVIARATNLGGVNWALVGLSFEGDAPIAAGCALFDGDKRIGEITSAVRSSIGGWIGLGYVRVTHRAEGTRFAVKAEDGTGRPGRVAARPLISASS